MGKRRLGALIGAAVLTFTAVGSVAAVPATPVLTITKEVDQATLPFGGGTVTYTITVTATTGTFHQVTVTDANCDSNTLAWQSGTGGSTAGPSGAGSAGFLGEGDSWVYTCTRALTDPGTYHNTASADGCTNGSVADCNVDSHAASGASNDAVTVVADQATANPTNNPTNIPTQAPTDVAVTGSSAPADTAWFLVIGLGVLLASLFVLRPTLRSRNRR
jgi:hypothetical protein